MQWNLIKCATKEILVGARVKRATSKKDAGPHSYGLFWKQYHPIPRKQKVS